MKPTDNIEQIVSNIQAEFQATGFLIFIGEHDGRVWIQVGTNRPDTYTKKMEVGKGGKAYVSEHASEDEVVKKMLGLCLAYAEHEVREGFKYKGVRLFNPHASIKKLMETAKGSTPRKPKKEEPKTAQAKSDTKVIKLWPEDTAPF